MATYTQSCTQVKCPPIEPEYIRPTGGPIRKLKEIPEHVTGYHLYCCDAHRQSGWFITQPHETWNIIGNPTFKNNLDLWSGVNANLSRTNDFSFSDGFSLIVRGSGDYQTTERNAYAQIEIPASDFVKGQTYTASVYAYLDEMWDLSDPNLGRISIVDQVGTDPATASFEEVFSVKLDKAQVWQRLAATKTIRPNADKVFVRLWLRSQNQRTNTTPFPETGCFNLPTEYVRYDMAQMELGLEATIPFHGDTVECGLSNKCCSGYKWTGIAHKSASYRPACARNGKLKNLCDYGFEIISHTGHSAPAVRDISIPYANRIGSSYQKTAIDERTLTFVSYNCGASLRELECEIFDFQNAIMPNVGQCSGEFLLVYRHDNENCEDDCERERDRAICVRYSGGFESANRDSLFRQNVTLQFTASQPAFFDFPGHTGHKIDFENIIQNSRVIKMDGDGTAHGYPIASGRDVSAVGCLPGADRIVFGGNFPQGIGPTNCDPNLAVFDCNALCQTGGVVGGVINDIEPDGQGNLILGGSFLSPGKHIAMLYGDTGKTGSFNDYPGGPVLSVATAPWSQVIVGTATGIHFLVDTFTDATQGWRTYNTNGPVYDIGIEPNGDVIFVGDFTTISGSGTPTVPNTNVNQTNRIARFSVNHNGCLDITRPEFRSLGYGFNAAVRAVEIDPENGDIYVGGDFTQAIPDAQNICTLVEDTSTQSRGANQEIIFTSLGGTSYRVELRITNPVAAQIINQCMTTPVQGSNTAYARITATSTSGSTYNLVLSGVPVLGTAGALTTMQFTIDTATALPAQCGTENAVFSKELSDSNRDVALFAGVPLTNGNGNDNTLNSYTLQCLGLQTTFGGNPVPVNRVAKLVGASVQPLGDGLSANVRALALHGQTKELWAGTIGAPTGFTDGLAIWNGQSWNNFPGNLAGRGPVGVRDIKYCPDDCSMVFVLDQDGSSKVYGSSSIDYKGNFENMDAQIVLHGPGRVGHIGHHPCYKMANLCTILQCDEVGTLNVGTAQLTSNNNRLLNNSILPGARLDFWLTKCDQRMSVYIDEGGATTNATVVYRPHYWGLEGMCCVKAQTPVKKNLCCNSRNLVQSRSPTQDDCRDQGYKNGDLWLDTFGCGQLFVLSDDKCCDTATNGLMGTGVPITTTPTGATTPQTLCPPGVNCVGTNPSVCPRMEITYVSPAGGTTSSNQSELTGLQPAVFDFPIAMNQSTVSYNFVQLVNLAPVPVTATWVTATRLSLTPTAPWPTTAKQLTFYQNAVSTDGNCRFTDNKVFNFT